jgi:hypothetical protein
MKSDNQSESPPDCPLPNGHDFPERSPRDYRNWPMTVDDLKTLANSSAIPQTHCGRPFATIGQWLWRAIEEKAERQRKARLKADQKRGVI